MNIIVGSENPVKIAAASQGFQKVWPDKEWITQGVNVPSGVSDQPMTDKESIKGARNRAQEAMNSKPADYAVGLEGGIQQIDDLWFDCGWIVVIDKKGGEGIGSTARIITPKKMIQKIEQGMELGHVVDEFFGTTNAKQQGGHFGLMTNGTITRTSGYVDGVIMALTRFIHPQLFE